MTEPVKGNRAQSDLAVETVNRNKELEEQVLRRIDLLFHIGDADQRWLAIGRTHIQEGFMAINRAIFQPERIRLQFDGDYGTEDKG